MKANASPRRRAHGRRTASGLGPSEDGVSDVLGAVLLVGITVAMMVGLSAVVLNLDGPRDRVHMDVRISVLPGAANWGTGDELVRVEHIGGESLATARARLVVDISGNRAVLLGSQLGQGFADGVFAVGDSWERSMTIGLGQTIEVLLIDTQGNAVTTQTRLSALGSGVSTGGGTGTTSGIVTYVATASVAPGKGAVLNVASARNGDDGGATATFSESSSGGTSHTVQRAPTSIVSSTNVNQASNVLVSNDQRATFGQIGSTLSVGGFSMPVNNVKITGVTIGFEGQRGSGSGSGSVIALGYEVGGVPGPVRQHTVGATSDTAYVTTVTTDRTWTVANIGALNIVLERQAGGRNTQVDHVYVSVTYSTPLITDLEATLGWTGIPPAQTQELQIRYRTSVESFTVQIWSGSAWVNRGTLNSPLFFSVYTTTLSPGEYNGGNLQVRIVDNDTGAQAGQIRIDYARTDSR